MAPIQVLTNNLLYDFSQTTIPTDNVDEVLSHNSLVADRRGIWRDPWVPPDNHVRPRVRTERD